MEKMEKKLENAMRRRLITLAAALLLSMVLSVSMVAAVDVFAIGEVIDGNGDPIASADISATCRGNTLTDVTDSNGRYGVDFTGICAVDDTVVVTATYQGCTGTSSGQIKDYQVVQIAVIDVVIPEFTTIAVPVAAILGLMFFFNRRKCRNAK